MTEIECRITRLAAIGRSPYQIEAELGIPHYTIHQKYHAALQAGYARRADLNDSKSKESKAVLAEPIERQYRQAGKEKRAEYMRQYREANKEKIAEHMRQYREANKEKIAEQKRRYREANKEKVAEQKRQYRARKRKEKHRQTGDSPE